MLICRNAEGVRGKRKVGNPWSSFILPKNTLFQQFCGCYFTCLDCFLMFVLLPLVRFRSETITCQKGKSCLFSALLMELQGCLQYAEVGSIRSKMSGLSNFAIQIPSWILKLSPSPTAVQKFFKCSFLKVLVQMESKKFEKCGFFTTK